MKKTTILFLVYYISHISFSQDTINHYNTDNIALKTLQNPELTPYDGEYQITIKSMYWYDNSSLPINLITYSLETRSLYCNNLCKQQRIGISKIHKN